MLLTWEVLHSLLPCGRELWTNESCLTGTNLVENELLGSWWVGFGEGEGQELPPLEKHLLQREEERQHFSCA